MDLLDRCKKTLEDRSDQYDESDLTNERAAKIASVMSNRLITVRDMYNMEIALKLARQAYRHKEDNILDAINYLVLLNKHEEKDGNKI